jgi:hypothetical protein
MAATLQMGSQLARADYINGLPSSNAHPALICRRRLLILLIRLEMPKLSNRATPLLLRFKDGEVCDAFSSSTSQVGARVFGQG